LSCSNCGAIVNEDDKECSSCGESLVDEPVNENAFTFWKDATNESELEYFKDLLEEESIEYVVMNPQSETNVFPFTLRNQPKKIFVTKNKIEQATTMYGESSKATFDMPTTFESEQPIVHIDKSREKIQPTQTSYQQKSLYSLELKLFVRSELKSKIREIIKSKENEFPKELIQYKNSLEHIFKQLEDGTILMLSQQEIETFNRLFSFLKSHSRFDSALENIEQKLNTFTADKNH